MRWTRVGWLATWAEAERGRFVPWLPVFMGAGVCTYFALTTEPHPWSGPVAVLAALLALMACWRSLAGRAIAAAVLAAALGFLSGQAATIRADPVESLPSRAVVLTATVHGVELLPDGRRVTLSAVRLGPDAPVLNRQVRVRLRRNDLVELRAGDAVRIRALLRPPPMPAYPGAWDLQREAFFSDLAGSGTALNPAEVIEQRPPQGFGARLQAARDAVAQRAAAGLPGPAGAVAAALFTGIQTAIPLADREAFRNSGLAHLLSVSGLHVGIVMGLLMGAVRFSLALHERTALHWPNKALAALVALAGSGAYVVFIGAQVPIMRSFAMACLVALGLVLGRRALSLRGLALAAAAVMAVAPSAVLSVSFQMSFAAVLALVAGFEALRPMLTRLKADGRNALSVLTALVLTSLLAGTASAPFGAYHFGHFQPYYIVSNLVAVPLTAFWVMPTGMAALALMPFGWESLALAPMGWGIEATLWLARTVASWPAATLVVPHMTAWGLALFSVGLIWLSVWRSRARLLGVVPILAGLLSFLADPPPDILVSPDARLIAVRSGDYYVQSRSGGSKFVLEAWENRLRSGPMLPLRTGEPASCGPETCRLPSQTGTVTIARNASPAGDCDGVVLLVSAEPARSECPSNVAVLDRFTVWRDGALQSGLPQPGRWCCPTASTGETGRGFQRRRHPAGLYRTCRWPLRKPRRSWTSTSAATPRDAPAP